jgi:hypothetical protein
MNGVFLVFCVGRGGKIKRNFLKLDTNIIMGGGGGTNLKKLYTLKRIFKNFGGTFVFQP